VISLIGTRVKTRNQRQVLDGRNARLADGVAILTERAARILPAGEALLLRGNGALTLGATPGLAVTRMWLLSTACDVCLHAHAADRVTPLSPAETLGTARSGRLTAAATMAPPGPRTCAAGR
jgi:hypothetical protein